MTPDERRRRHRDYVRAWRANRLRAVDEARRNPGWDWEVICAVAGFSSQQSTLGPDKLHGVQSMFVPGYTALGNRLGGKRVKPQQLYSF